MWDTLKFSTQNVFKKSSRKANCNGISLVWNSIFRSKYCAISIILLSNAEILAIAKVLVFFSTSDYFFIFHCKILIFVIKNIVLNINICNWKVSSNSVVFLFFDRDIFFPPAAHSAEQEEQEERRILCIYLWRGLAVNLLRSV